MQSSKTNYIFVSNALWYAIAFLILQQIVVASSTIWITQLIAHIQEEKFSYILLGLYLASLVIPYFPGAAALVEIEKAKLNANLHYVKLFENAYKGQIYTWTNSGKHSSVSSILTNEAPQTLSGYIDYLYHFASCGLNVTLNLLVLAFILEPWLLASYLIGLLCAFFILKLQKKRKKILSLRAQQGRIKWVTMLLKAWDNILLGNSYNLNIWRERTYQRGKRFYASQIKLEGYSQFVSVGMALALIGPSLILIGYLPIIYDFDLSLLAIMIVALPRLFQVLSYSYELLFVLADFPMQKSRLKTVVNLLDESNLLSLEQGLESMEKRINWDKISISSDQKNIIPSSLLNSLPNKGRYTVKGVNGCGKSTLLVLIKKMRGEAAFYLPVKHDLSFQITNEGLSTGQSIRKNLHELSLNLETPIILLDEWDANLDLVNQEQLSKLIDQLSENRCVIEVRHR